MFLASQQQVYNKPGFDLLFKVHIVCGYKSLKYVVEQAEPLNLDAQLTAILFYKLILDLQLAESSIQLLIVLFSSTSVFRLFKSA